MSVILYCFELFIRLVHTRNSDQEKRASSSFVDHKRSADGDDQAKASSAKRELGTPVSNGHQVLDGQGRQNE